MLDAADDHDHDTDAAASPRTFVHAAEFAANLLDFCTQPTEAVLDRLKSVLDYYQNDPYLLEPFLGQLSEQPIQAFREAFVANHASSSTSSPSPVTPALHLHAIYLYWLSKVVTAKVLIRYFPHSVADFSLLLSIITVPAFHSYPWEARYILLLWLSLVINIPFSLDNFGQSVYDSLEENILKVWLRATGKERDAAALFGSKYFNRRDISEKRLSAFLGWCGSSLLRSSDDPFLPVGIFQFLNALLQDANRQTMTPHVRSSLYTLATLYDSENTSSNLSTRLASPLLRRLRVKYVGRLATTYLSPRTSRRLLKTPSSMFGTSVEADPSSLSGDMIADVPEEVDTLLSGLMESLADSDSRVRWTASKAISKIAAHVPFALVDEIVGLISGLYKDDVLHSGTDQEDLSFVSASAWHGATLCLASMIRQNLLNSKQIANVFPWIQKALTFSQRKGAQKIGGNVRDSACYFCWCLARATTMQGDLLSPEGVADLSRALVVVACLDEEPSVRRAASAAFQECAGRMSGIEEGLEVLQLMDAQMVGSRRNAYLGAAPSIAKRYHFYRTRLLRRLRRVLLYHPDGVIRELSSKSIKKILEGHPENILVEMQDEIERLKTVKESRVAHGSLLLLVSLSSICQSKDLKSQALLALGSLPASLCVGGPAAALLPVIGQLAQVCLKQEPSATLNTSNMDHKNVWRRFVDVAQRRPESSSHDGAGELVNAISSQIDCLNDLKRWSGTSPTSQQCVTALLGYFDFSPSSTSNLLLGVTIDRLLKVMNPENTPNCKTIDAKCNCLKSLGRLYLQYHKDTQCDRERVIAAFFDGLEDYTNDQRGEVGSLVRCICFETITSIVLLQRTEGVLSDALVDKLVIQLLKQSVDKLDTVREQAARQLGRLSVVRKVVPEELLQDWRQLETAIQTVLGLITNMDRESRLTILSGIVTSTGTHREVHLPATSLFLEWMKALPRTDNTMAYNASSVMQDILDIIRTPKATNRVIVPALHTLAASLEDVTLRPSLNASVFESANEIARMVASNSRIASKMEAAQRLQEACATSTGLPRISSDSAIQGKSEGDDRSKTVV